MIGDPRDNAPTTARWRDAPGSDLWPAVQLLSRRTDVNRDPGPRLHGPPERVPRL